MTVGRRRAAIVVAVLVAAAAWLRLGPLPDGLLDFQNAESTEVVDRSGEVLYEARSNDGSRAAWLSPENLPASLIDAELSLFDRNSASDVTSRSLPSE